MSQSKQPRYSPPSKALDDSVMCPTCQFKFVSSIHFDEKRNCHCAFDIELFENLEDQSSVFRTCFTCTETDEVNQRFSVLCPLCNKTFWLSVDLLKIIDEREIKIKMSFKTEDKNQEDKQRGNRQAVENSDTNQSAVRKRHRVKVFYKSSGETFGAAEDIKKQLKSNKFAQLEETKLHDCSIIIMFCPITSRVGSDVESSMKDARVSSSGKPVILVLMHHTRDPEYSTAGTNWSEVYGNVVLNVDVLFHETLSGLLTCRRNDDAFKIIRNELSKHSKYWA
ncbi:hypothetical protein CRENBAI_022718 [Crenichthys baileyi]|uniref:Uncharacterized protein n=1 Tax=Crenichthys baileyi TaxID=28760 RepID=A0AAV9SIK9_9TELE